MKLMKINVPHVAKLAGLTLSDKEIKTFEKQLGSVLDYIDKLKEVNTEKIEETSQVTNLENVTREDTLDESRTLTQEEAISNTKSQENGLFKVKGILNEE